jgi:hypothetical protein
MLARFASELRAEFMQGPDIYECEFDWEEVR